MLQKQLTYSSLTDNCNVYVQERLPLLSDRNASCPFKDGICKAEFDNIRLDTGYMNSHQDLGLNAPLQERFSLRLTSHCAPLKTVGFNDTFTFIDDLHDNRSTRLFRLFYGRWDPYFDGPRHTNYANYTFQFPLNTSKVMLKSGSTYTAPTVDYSLGYVFDSRPQWKGGYLTENF